MLTMAVRI